MKKKVAIIACCAGLFGCSAKGPMHGYVYTPKDIHQDFEMALALLAYDSYDDPLVDIEYVKEQSLLKITSHAGPDMRFVWGVGRERLYKKFCYGDDKFFSGLRDYGVGIEVRLVDDSKTEVLGPFNVDACLQE